MSLLQPFTLLGGFRECVTKFKFNYPEILLHANVPHVFNDRITQAIQLKVTVCTDNHVSHMAFKKALQGTIFIRTALHNIRNRSKAGLPVARRSNGNQNKCARKDYQSQPL